MAVRVKTEFMNIGWNEGKCGKEIISVQKPKPRGRPSKNAKELFTESSNTPYKCPICNNYFSQKGNLQVHMRTHTDERPFTCKFCPFSARQKINLLIHLRKHTKERPYNCSFCDFTTAQIANLRAHVQRMHEFPDPFVTEVVLKVKMFKCNFCSFINRKKKEVAKHRKAVHSQNSTDYSSYEKG